MTMYATEFELQPGTGQNVEVIVFDPENKKEVIARLSFDILDIARLLSIASSLPISEGHLINLLEDIHNDL